MKITQIRNATLHLEFAGSKFLIDPLLAKKGAFPGFLGTVNSHLSNPLVDLPMSLAEIVDVDAVVVTHTHPDHWDELAQSHLPKSLPIFVQDQHDRDLVQSQGFADVRVLTESTSFNGIEMVKVPGRHGTDQAYEAIGEILGHVCGVIFRHPNDKVLYLAGDTVWNQFVIDNLATHTPDVIVLNCGDAQVEGVGSIIMGKRDVQNVCGAAPSATVIASHMEAVNHCVLTRNELRDFAQLHGFSQQVLIPEDGEIFEL